MSCGCTHTPSCNPCCTCPPNVSYTYPTCAGGEVCEEISDVKCVNYGVLTSATVPIRGTRPNLPALFIAPGDRLETILLKLHRRINSLLSSPIPIANHTATNTATTAPIAPFVVTYLGLGPVYNSAPGATGSGTTITVGSTTGLAVGMTVIVVTGTGAFAANTTVTAITNATTFVVSAAPTTALSGGATVVRGTGTDHQIFTINVVAGTPQTFAAFVGSPVAVSGTGTIV